MSPPIPPLARFIQVSDLHFGPLSTGGVPHAPALYLRRPFDGWLAHDPLATRELARFVRRLRRDAVPVYVVTTGDLTAWGEPVQFAKAAEYLSGVVQDGPSRVGLREVDWLNRAIPGNHDHWNGAHPGGTLWKFPQMWGPPTQPFHQLFGNLPQLGTPPLSVVGLPPVRFIRLDTDADVLPYTRDRLLARGSFRSHVAWLDTNLPAKTDGEVRVLLAHHCRERRGRTVEINQPSRDALDDLVVRHQVDVLLSGHTHKIGISTPTVTSSAGSRPILYARCGTSTGVNPHDERFKRAVGRWDADVFPLAKVAERSVVVHEVGYQDGRVSWTAVGHRLSRQNRFEPLLDQSASIRV